MYNCALPRSASETTVIKEDAFQGLNLTGALVDKPSPRTWFRQAQLTAIELSLLARRSGRMYEMRIQGSQTVTKDNSLGFGGEVSAWFGPARRIAANDSPEFGLLRPTRLQIASARASMQNEMGLDN
jgi:hypothetical protein